MGELELRYLRPDDEMGFLQGSGLKESVFKNLVYQALRVCVRGVHEIISSLPAGGEVPPSSIVRITPLDESCGDPEAGLDFMCDREGRCRICDEDAAESLSAPIMANGYLGEGFSG